MKKIRLFLLLYVCLLTLPVCVFSQVDTAWVRRYHGGYGTDFANAIAVDTLGNVYVAGYTYYMTTSDFLTVKYLPNGDTAWVRRYSGSANGNDWARAIAVDASGNVYVTGEVVNSGVNGVDYATVKYNSSGVLEWVRTYHGPSASGYDYPKAIALDNAGNIYVTGVSWYGTNDEDFVTIKYRPNGDSAWIRNYNSPDNGTDVALAIAVSSNGSVCVAGSSNDGSSESDIVIIKYDTSGVQQWLRSYRLGYYNEPTAVKFDLSGNIYIAGYGMNLNTGFDCIAIKYLANGDTAWVRTYNSAGANGDKANAMAVDNQNNVIITGTKGGANDDCLTVKYNANGVEQWEQSYNGLGNIDDQGNVIAVDNNNNIYVTGFTYDTTYNYLTIKYNASGSQQWIKTYNGPGNVEDRAYAIAVDNLGYCYITGTSGGISTDFDCATIKYLAGQGIEEIENWKLKSENLSVYPNPARNYFTIHCPQNVDYLEIKIFDVTGKAVKDIVSQAHSESYIRISLDRIKNGIYFVSLNNIIIREKLIIQK